jgi:hypothetical protein
VLCYSISINLILFFHRKHRPNSFCLLKSFLIRMMQLLESLPIEILLMISVYLDIGDIGSLRLTNHQVENRISHSPFTSCFHRKTINLTERVLHKLVWLTSRSRLVCLLQHCVLVLNPTSGKALLSSRRRRRLQNLLVETFRNLKKFSPRNNLKSLGLSLTRLDPNVCGMSSTEIQPEVLSCCWLLAIPTFELTMHALYESQLPIIEQLNIFGDIRGCSLALDTFVKFNWQSIAANVLGSLKKLTLSLSSMPPGKQLETAIIYRIDMKRQ